MINQCRKTHSFRHWDLVQLHGFRGLTPAGSKVAAACDFDDGFGFTSFLLEKATLNDGSRVTG